MLITTPMQVSTELSELRIWPINYLFPAGVEERMTVVTSFSQIQKHKF